MVTVFFVLSYMQYIIQVKTNKKKAEKEKKKENNWNVSEIIILHKKYNHLCRLIRC